MNRKFAILIYHRVLDQPDPMRPFEVDRETFSQQLGVLSRSCHVLPLAEAVQRSGEGSLPPRSVCITFDDGYADNAENALPLLLEYGAIATFFIATGFTGGGFMFNDLVIEAVRACRDSELVAPWREKPIDLGDTAASRASAITKILKEIKYLPYESRQERARSLADAHGADLAGCRMMRSSQLRKLADAGMEIGGHTVSHPILSNISNERARAEIEGGKAKLEDILQREVRAFAYPNGRRDTDYTDRDVVIAEQCGFDYALSTEWGLASDNSPRYELPRVSIGRQHGWRLWMKSILQRY